MSKTYQLFDDLPKYTRNDRLLELGYPIDDEDLSEFAVRVNALLDLFKLEPADIVRDCPSASYSTFCGWTNGCVDVPLSKKLTREFTDLFGITVDFLFYGVPITERDFHVDRSIREMKNKESA